MRMKAIQKFYTQLRVSNQRKEGYLKMIRNGKMCK